MFILNVIFVFLMFYNGIYGDANAEAESDNVNHYANSLTNARKGEDNIMDAIKTIKTGNILEDQPIFTHFLTAKLITHDHYRMPKRCCSLTQALFLKNHTCIPYNEQFDCHANITKVSDTEEKLSFFRGDVYHLDINFEIGMVECEFPNKLLAFGVDPDESVKYNGDGSFNVSHKNSTHKFEKQELCWEHLWGRDVFVVCAGPTNPTVIVSSKR